MRESVMAPILRWRRALAEQDAKFDRYLAAEQNGEIPPGGGLALDAVPEPTPEQWRLFLEANGGGSWTRATGREKGEA